MDFRNLEGEFNERQAPNTLEFITSRYHVLRKIYQNFDRVSFVKRTSLYLKSRARPAEKTHFKNTQHQTLVGPPDYSIHPTE